MSKLLLLALFAGAFTTLSAQEKKPDEPKKEPPPKPEPTLKVGDAAPALKADKWLQGAEVKTFSPGKLYVVEFWATWCGPCIVMMPHMGELQKEFADKGLTIVGFSSKDQNNTQEKVSAFVEKRGPKLGYTFAYEDTRETNTAWMKAAGQNGIPCCFVVDKAGKIAYIGHPMYLDIVLPKVVDGSWTAKDVDVLEEIEKEVTGVFRALGGADAQAGLDTLAAFEKQHPRLAGIPYFHAGKLNAMLKVEKFDEAKIVAQNLISKATKQGDPLALQTVSAVMRSPLAGEKKELLALSVKAATAQLTIAGESDISALLNVAASYEASGEKSKATEFGKKALPLAEKEVKSDKDYSGLLRVAEAAYLAGEKDKAKEQAEKAVEAAPMQLKRFIEGRAKKYLGDAPKKDEKKVL